MQGRGTIMVKYRSGIPIRAVRNVELKRQGTYCIVWTGLRGDPDERGVSQFSIRNWRRWVGLRCTVN